MEPKADISDWARVFLKEFDVLDGRILADACCEGVRVDISFDTDLVSEAFPECESVPFPDKSMTLERTTVYALSKLIESLKEKYGIGEEA